MEKSNITKKKSYDFSDEVLAALILDHCKINNRYPAVSIYSIARKLGFKIEDDLVSGYLAGNIFIDLAENDKIIMVNKEANYETQQVIIARLLADYLEASLKMGTAGGLVMSNSITYEDIFQKHEAFILNILAPDKMFISQYVRVITEFNKDSEEYLDSVYSYLQKRFKVTEEFIFRKIMSLGLFSDRTSLLANKCDLGKKGILKKILKRSASLTPEEMIGKMFQYSLDFTESNSISHINDLFVVECKWDERDLEYWQDIYGEDDVGNILYIAKKQGDCYFVHHKKFPIYPWDIERNGGLGATCYHAEKLINYLTEEERRRIISTNGEVSLEFLDAVLARLREEYKEQKQQEQRRKRDL